MSALQILLNQQKNAKEDSVLEKGIIEFTKAWNSDNRYAALIAYQRLDENYKLYVQQKWPLRLRWAQSRG